MPGARGVFGNDVRWRMDAAAYPWSEVGRHRLSSVPWTYLSHYCRGRSALRRAERRTSCDSAWSKRAR